MGHAEKVGRTQANDSEFLFSTGPGGTEANLKMGSYLVSVLIHGDAVYKLSLSRGSGRASVVS